MESFKGGWIMLIVGGMYAGKSEELVRVVRRSIHGKRSVLLFKPEDDTRSGDDYITTHNGDAIKAIVVQNVAAMISYLDTTEKLPDMVAVDEAQFLNLKELLQLASTLANKGVKIAIATLDKKWDGSSFDGVGDLLAEADIVKKLHAICADCGNLASHSHRLSDSKDDVEVGDNYQPLCRECFQKAMLELR